jgi:hypothetical protein
MLDTMRDINSVVGSVLERVAVLATGRDQTKVKMMVTM